MSFTDLYLTRFDEVPFTGAFQRYFAELGISVTDWPALFREMNAGENAGFLRLDAAGRAVGFIQFCPLALTSWFFEERAGFVREFWVAPEFRGEGHGGALLRLAEERMEQQGAGRALLTTDSAAAFYEKRGYRAAPHCTAKNGDAVFEKRLG